MQNKVINLKSSARVTRLSPACFFFSEITCSSCLKVPRELSEENSGGMVHLVGNLCSTASFVPCLISPLKLLVKESFLSSILQERIFPLRRERTAELCSQASAGSKPDAPVYIDAICIGTTAYHTQKYIKTYAMG